MHRAGKTAVAGVVFLMALASVGVAAAGDSVMCDQDPTRLECLAQSFDACAATFDPLTQPNEWTRCHTQAIGEWLCPEGSECREIYKEHAGTCSSLEPCAGLLDLLDDYVPFRP